MKKNERGQALLIIVLVMVVALTVGLSVASRSITNLRTSTEEANSQKALAAAEAGIEQAIKNNNNVSISDFSFNNNTASYKTDIKQVDGKNVLLYGGNPVIQDNGIDVWLSDYSADPSKIYLNPWPAGGATENLTIKWGVSSDPCSNAAIEFVLIYGPKATPQIKRYAFDPCSTRASANRFAPVSSSTKSTTSGKDFYYEARVPVSLGLIGRVIPLYTNTPIALLTDITALPSQGSTVTSVGKSGGTERKVIVFQGYPEIPPEYFQNILFSP